MSIELRLECSSQNEVMIRFRLSITNHEPDRILIPIPEVTGLQFTDATGTHAEWYTNRFVSALWSGVLLESEESKASTFTVLPRWIERYPDDYDINSYRWVVGITTSRYDVRYTMAVDVDYFDPDSHYGLPQIARKARERSARAWTGEAESNVVSIDYNEPEGEWGRRMASLLYPASSFWIRPGGPP
jgi:hypothetical protein